MRGFILGVIVTLLVVCCGAYFYATTGHFDTRAVGPAPSSFERKTANTSVDEWVEAHAPNQPNPFQPSTENLLAGQKIYDDNCAFCHGNLKQPISPMRNNFYPSVPQLTSRVPHDPDNEFFYIAKYGIRFTGMPGWDGVLSDDDIWKAVLFIKNSDKMKDSAPAATPAQ